VICFLVQPKLAVHYHRYWIAMHWARWMGRADDAGDNEKKYRKRMTDEAKEKMVSLDVCVPSPPSADSQFC
jgi:hypothetical protein